MKYQNELILQAARGETPSRTPIWLMRQAGRILAEYRAVREKAGSFRQLVTNPELAATVTVQPVDLLGVDVAIIFSDILVIPEAMGLPYEMEEKKGPVFPKRITQMDDLKQLRVAVPEESLAYVLEALKISRQMLGSRVPLIGFAGAPWTIFAYMTEGRGSKTFSEAKKMLYTQPALATQLLQLITDSTIQYLKAQVRAGADLIQLFDSWAGVLSPAQYEQFSLPYIQQILTALESEGIPRIVFAKGAFFAREAMNSLPAEVVGLDWNMDITTSRSLMPDKVLQGNLDPCALYADAGTLKKEVTAMMQAFGPTKHIANLGHGLYPDTEVDKVKLFIDLVKDFRF